MTEPFEGRLADCPHCGTKQVTGQRPNLVKCGACGQPWYDVDDVTVSADGSGEILALDNEVLRSDLKRFARIVRSFVNGGGLTAGDFRELDSLVRDGE